MYDFIIKKLQEVKYTIEFIDRFHGTQKSAFITESCEACDTLDTLISLQLDVYCCIQRVVRVFQLPILVALLLFLCGIVVQLIETYTRFVLFFNGEHTDPRGLVFAVPILFLIFGQLNYVTKGPQLVVDKNKELVLLLNSIFVKNIENRLENSVRNLF